MTNIIKPIDWALRWLLIILAAFMILTVSWQVFSRYALRAPSSLTEEIARFQLIWLGLLGAVYTFRNRMHIGIDLLVSSLPKRKRQAAELFSLVSVLVFAVVILVYGGGKLVALTHELDQTSAALGVRMSYIYSVIPASGVLICLYALQYIADLVLLGKIHKTNPLDPSDLTSSIGEER